jgi:hypothetical protein
MQPPLSRAAVEFRHVFPRSQTPFGNAHVLLWQLRCLLGYLDLDVVQLGQQSCRERSIPKRSLGTREIPMTTHAGMRAGRSFARPESTRAHRHRADAGYLPNSGRFAPSAARRSAATARGCAQRQRPNTDWRRLNSATAPNSSATESGSRRWRDPWDRAAA